MATKDLGNNVQDSSFMRAMMAFKENIFSTLHGAEVVKVDNVTTEYIGTVCQCTAINSLTKITCVALQNLTINEGDIAVVLFTDTDFRSNLRRIKQGLNSLENKSTEYHSINFGILIGKI